MGGWAGGWPVGCGQAGGKWGLSATLIPPQSPPYPSLCPGPQAPPMHTAGHAPGRTPHYHTKKSHHAHHAILQPPAATPWAHATTTHHTTPRHVLHPLLPHARPTRADTLRSMLALQPQTHTHAQAKNMPHLRRHDAPGVVLLVWVKWVAAKEHGVQDDATRPQVGLLRGAWPGVGGGGSWLWLAGDVVGLIV